jgi:hypothetical protein
MTFGKAAQNMDLFVRIIRLLTEKIHINVVVCATEYRELLNLLICAGYWYLKFVSQSRFGS